ncbi:MAG: ribonuclease Y [Chloroflexi bacterium]|nr:ribonuclease Y [Chloroflexota bacterium]|tara:strand:+ start:3245 stop:4777 length:1533 start_codon:yes stop_codon:yes gene_type:complete
MDLQILSVILVAVLSVLLGVFLALLFNKIINSKNIQAAKEAATQQIRISESRSKEILIEAKEEAHNIRLKSESKFNQIQINLDRLESKLDTRENLIKDSESKIKIKENNIEKKLKKTKKHEDEIEIIRDKFIQQLESISGLTMEQAKESLLEEANNQISYEISRRYREAELISQSEIDEKAKMLLAESLQRYASEVVQETTINAVSIPNEDMKGRLIGREGRNIRAIENVTGTDLLIDEDPETVSVSCFDPIRRKIAILTVEKLIQDGRIHPAKIEEIYQRSKSEIEEMVRKSGQKAVFEVNVKGLHPEIIKLIGRLQYRYSYGENVLQHSIEVGIIAGMLASQLNINIQNSKMAGFLHDIGKALTHEVEGSHAVIGADIVKKYGVREPIITAIKEHHDTHMSTVESFVVAAADAISAARPGARHDTLEAYVERLEQLENVASEFEGVQKVFAIQAGREVRVMVNPENVDDVSASSLARNIVNRIEETLTYPGQIKVIVIRESRSEEIAS